MFHSRCRPRHFARIAPLAALLSAVFVSASALPACVGSSFDPVQVVETMRTMYAAATTDDLAKFHSVAAPDFYAFDGDALMSMVKSFHDKGVVFVWSITRPHVESDCHLAWMTYINHGSMKDASGTKDLAWLESAILEKQTGVWRIRFFQSARVAGN